MWGTCTNKNSIFAPSTTTKRSRTVVEMVKKSVGTLTEADLKGKVVLVRSDLNVPLDGKKITDDTRIRASVPTIKYLVDKGAKVLLPTSNKAQFN